MVCHGIPRLAVSAAAFQAETEAIRQAYDDAIQLEPLEKWVGGFPNLDIMLMPIPLWDTGDMFFFNGFIWFYGMQHWDMDFMGCNMK